jgi:hypothetical protein
MATGPMGLGTTNHCIGKEHQQFIGLDGIMLLGNSLINIFPWQRRTVGGVIFHAVCVISKESRRLMLTRTSCYNFNTSILHTLYTGKHYIVFMHSSAYSHLCYVPCCSVTWTRLYIITSSLQYTKQNYM